MAKHAWSMLCKVGILDNLTNSVSLINVFDEVALTTPGELPSGWVSFPFSAMLASQVVRSQRDIPERCQIKIDVVASDGDVHPRTIIQDVDLTTAVRSRVLTELSDLACKGAGIVRFVVSLRSDETQAWSAAGDVPLEVRHVIQPQSFPNAEQMEPKEAEPAQTAHPKKQPARKR